MLQRWQDHRSVIEEAIFLVEKYVNSQQSMTTPETYKKRTWHEEVTQLEAKVTSTCMCLPPLNSGVTSIAVRVYHSHCYPNRLLTPQGWGYLVGTCVPRFSRWRFHSQKVGVSFSQRGQQLLPLGCLRWHVTKGRLCTVVQLC